MAIYTEVLKPVLSFLLWNPLVSVTLVLITLVSTSQSRLMNDQFVLKTVRNVFLAFAFAIATYYIVVHAIVVATIGYYYVTAPTVEFLQGGDIYHAIEYERQYSAQYGPYTYLIQAMVLTLFNFSKWSSKLVLIIPAVLTPVLFFFIARRHVTLYVSLIISALGLVLLLRMGAVPGMSQRDGVIFFFATIFVFLADRLDERKRGYLNFLVLGVVVGSGLTYKVHAPLYALPMVFLLFARHPPRYLLFLALVGSTIAIIPYMHPKISFKNHFDILFAIHGDNKLFPYYLRQNFQYVVMYLLPFLLLFKTTLRDPEIRLFFVGAVVAAIPAIIIGSFKGAGFQHIWPFVLVLLYGLARLWAVHREEPPQLIWQLVGALLVVNLLVALPVQYWSLKHLLNPRTAAMRSEIADDLIQFVETHPNQKTALGDGGKPIPGTSESKPLPDRLHPDGGIHPNEIHAVLWALRQPVTFDSSAVDSFQKGKKPMPEAAVQYLEKCPVENWLIPRNERPFTITSSWTPSLEVFDERFRKAFRSAYAKDTHTKFFDVYRCRATR